MKVNVAALSESCCLLLAQQSFPQIQRAPFNCMDTDASPYLSPWAQAQLPISISSQANYLCQQHEQVICMALPQDT